MAANYSTNPTNPVNQNGGAMQAAGQVPVIQAPNQVQAQPKSIKEYLNIARSQGVAPRFHNVPGAPGMQVGEPAPAITDISQVKNEYDRLPFSKKVRMDPYQRAKMRMEDVLPQLWEQMFPGMAQGAILDEAQMKAWQGAVAAVASKLVEHYDKQAGEYQKYEQKAMKSKDDERRFWQAKYVDARLRGAPILNDQGQPMSEKEFVNERLSMADEMGFQKHVEDTESQAGPAKSASEPLSAQDVRRVFADPKNKGLKEAVFKQKEVFMKNGDMSEGEAAFEAVNYYSDKIREALNSK